MGNKVENLLSRIVALEDCFDSPPSGVPEQRCRADLIRCGLPFLVYSPYSFPLRKLNAIKEQLRLFLETSGSLLSADVFQASEEAFRLLEDIQEAILDYQVRSRPDILLTVDGDSRRCNRQCSTTKV